MHAILEKLRTQHRDLSRIVALLERLPSLEPDPAAPNIGLLVDALVYLTSFPDVTHHPLEDRIAQRLRDRRLIDPDLCVELEGQHARLARRSAIVRMPCSAPLRTHHAS